MIFEATGSTTYGELSIDSINLREDNQLLTDLFNILSNQVGKDIPFEGSTYRPVNQLRDAIGRIKSGTYSMGSQPQTLANGGIQVIPVTKEAMGVDTSLPSMHLCPKCHRPHDKYLTVCDQCLSVSVATTPHPAFICPKCYGQSNGTICQQCRSGEVETRMAQGPNTSRTYTHTCHNCHCQCSISNVGPTLRDCPECGTTDMIRTMDVNP